MPAKNEVTFTIRARDMTGAAFRRVRRGFVSLGRSLTSLRGLVAGGLFAAAVTSMTRFGESISAASERLRMSTVTLQAWKRQAEDVANVGGETLFNVFQRINRNAGEALRGNTRMIESFQRMGISFAQLRTASPDEIMLRIAAAAERFNKAGKRREFASMLAEIGDTEAVRLLGLLERGPGAFVQETQRLIASGTIQTAEALRASAETAARLREETAKAERAFAETMTEALPLIAAGITNLNATIEAATALVRTLEEKGGGSVARGAANAVFPQVTGAETPRFLGFTPPGAHLILSQIRDSSRDTAKNTAKLSGEFRLR